MPASARVRRNRDRCVPRTYPRLSARSRDSALVRLVIRIHPPAPLFALALGTASARRRNVRGSGCRRAGAPAGYGLDTGGRWRECGKCAKFRCLDWFSTEGRGSAAAQRMCGRARGSRGTQGKTSGYTRRDAIKGGIRRHAPDAADPEVKSPGHP